MRLLFVLSLLAAIVAAQTTPPASTDRGAVAKPTAERSSSDRGAPTTRIPALVSNAETRIYPLMNVELTDIRGFKTKLFAFHRISGENIFRGFLGAAQTSICATRHAKLLTLPLESEFWIPHINNA